jgi:hypothetical protein
MAVKPFGCGAPRPRRSRQLQMSKPGTSDRTSTAAGVTVRARPHSASEPVCGYAAANAATTSTSPLEILSTQFGRIAIGDLSIKGLARGLHAKRVNDASYLAKTADT